MMPFTVFKDRAEAGRRLADALQSFRGSQAVVIALPRGGVVTGAALAEALGLPLDVLVVGKLGAPGRPELGIGAVAEGAPPQLDWPLIHALGIPQSHLEAEIQSRRRQIERRQRRYRGGQPAPLVQGRPTIVVDDGAATGNTLLAALRALVARGPSQRIAAVPVCPPEVVPLLQAEADRVVVLATPSPFGAVSLWYRQFEPVSDEEVRALLARPSPRARGA